MAEKKEYVSYISPKGVVKWAHLTEPQTVIGDKPVDPNYNVTLLFDPNAADIITLSEQITKLHADALAAAKKAEPKKKLTDMGLENCFKDDTTKDGEPTGKVAFKFKHKAGGERRDKTVWSFKPFIYDAYGKPLAPGTVIYGGSIVEVNYGVKHTVMATGSFYTSLQLNAAVVSVLKSAMDRDASSFGFKLEKAEAEEGQDAFGEQLPDSGAGVDAHGSSDF